MGRLFGTDGIRDVANKQLDSLLALKIGMAAATLQRKQSGRERPLFLVGKDPRISSDMLAAALSAGLCACGADVVQLGTVPTPAVAFLLDKLGAGAGVMISASHNPFEYNGIKIFGAGGYKLSDALEEEIESIALDGSPKPDIVTHGKIGRISREHGAVGKYISHLASASGGLDGMRIALDCSGGSASRTAEKLFSRLGAEVTVFHDKTDGTNINDGCGSTHIKNLVSLMGAGRFDMGFAFDGDADRCIAVDDLGNPADGDVILALLALRLREENRLPANTIVATVMSNLGLLRFAEKNGFTCKTAAVGDRYVLEEMLSGGFALGGEQSGHIILSDYMTTGDGQLTAVLLADTVKKSGRPLSELRSVFRRYPQSVRSVPADPAQKQRFEQDGEIRQYIEALSGRLSDGRILARASGTEPLIRVMAEGADVETVRSVADELATYLEKRLRIK